MTNYRRIQNYVRFHDAREDLRESERVFLKDLKRDVREQWPGLKVRESRRVTYGFLATAGKERFHLEFVGLSWRATHKEYGTIKDRTLVGLRSQICVTWGIDLPEVRIS